MPRLRIALPYQRIKTKILATIRTTFIENEKKSPQIYLHKYFDYLLLENGKIPQMELIKLIRFTFIWQIEYNTIVMAYQFD